MSGIPGCVPAANTRGLLLSPLSCSLLLFFLSLAFCEVKIQVFVFFSFILDVFIIEV